jgi:hypothetical protein
MHCATSAARAVVFAVDAECNRKRVQPTWCSRDSLSHIHILNRSALEAMACECYAVIRQKTEKVFAASPPAKVIAPTKLRRDPGQ